MQNKNWLCRVGVIYIVLFTPLLTSMAGNQDISKARQQAAKKLSDSFVADLIANRTEEVVHKFHLRDSDKALFESMIRKPLLACGTPYRVKDENGGKPIVGEYTHAGGTDSFRATGRTNPTLIFVYLLETRDGISHQFNTEVELDSDGREYILTFSCHPPIPRN